MDAPDTKYELLKRLLNEMGTVLVAFSGGVDSTLLLHAAHEALGNQAVAVTIDAPFHSRSEINDAQRLAARIGARHRVLDVRMLDLSALDNNPEERCYLCKKAVFGLCLEVAAELGCAVVADGSNQDDLGEYRPGRRALAELAVRSPLLEAGLTKVEIRELSRRCGLETWDKPALACLLTRFPHGEIITPERLARVERGEEFLRMLGFGQLRVRSLGDAARIELALDEIGRLTEPEMYLRVTSEFLSAGFTSVSVDQDGYRCGSMNPENIA